MDLGELRQILTDWASRIVRFTRIASAGSDGSASVAGRGYAGGPAAPNIKARLIFPFGIRSVPPSGVDAAVNAGANGVSGPSLSRSDSDALYRDALKHAVADADEKAKALAAASGLTLGGVHVIVEGAQSSPPIPFATKDAAASATPIEPGTQEIGASVTVTYDAS